MKERKNKSTITLNRIRILFFISLHVFVFLCLIQADGGYISMNNILVFEPSQSAIIGWAQTREVLVLSTNVYTDNQNTNWVIELIPFPSLPDPPVAGTLESFQAAMDLIDNFIGKPQSGDVNRDIIIDIIDALLIAQYYVGMSPTGFYKITADVSGNQVIDIVDALLIAQYYVGLSGGRLDGRLDDINVVFKSQIGNHNITVV